MPLDTETGKKIVLYVGHDLSELQVINKLVPELVSMGVEPVLAMVAKRSYKNTDSDTEHMRELGFYHGDLLQKTVIPFLEQHSPFLDPQGNLKSGICYTPTQLANHYNLEMAHVEDVNSIDHVAWIKNDPHIGGALSLRCTHIFQQPVIDALHEKGFLWNVHPGQMPEIRGVLPVYRALEAGHREIQWSLHSIVDPTIDTGPVHRVTSQPADFKKGSVFRHYNENADGVSAMVLGALQDVLDGNSPKRMAQVRRKGTLYTFPDVDASTAFNKAGGSFVEPKNKMIDYYAKTFAGKGSPLRRRLEAEIEGAVEAKFGGSHVAAAPVLKRPVNDRGPRSGPSANSAVA